MSKVYEDIRWLKPEIDGELDGIDGPYLNIDVTINKKLHLFMGEAWTLPVDVIVIGQNENLSDRTECAAILALTGPMTENELLSQCPLQTGRSLICSGGYLCPYLISSVGPKYNPAYLTASVHALFSAYKSALFLCSETKDVHVVAICPIYLLKGGFPREQACHIALRTLRKVLEHSILTAHIEKVVLCVSPDDFDIYQLNMTGDLKAISLMWLFLHFCFVKESVVL